MTHFPRPWCKYARERHEGGDKAMTSAQKRTAATTARCQNAECGKKFTPARGWQRYCAPRCRQAAHFQRKLGRTKGLMAACPQCGNEFFVRMTPTL